jgi:xanthine dehydrogenase accessory factor
MLAHRRLADRAAALMAQGTPFVQATVVRAQCPTSTRPGDSAIILADGTFEGFIGGQCAEGSVRSAAAALFDSGETLLLRILPEGEADFPESEGAETVVNPCLSGGAVEVFLEPMLPAMRVALVGSSPIAEALELFAGHLGFVMQSCDPKALDLADCGAVLISTHGRYEAETIRAALDAGAQFIGLVASKTRGEAVLDELALSDEQRRIVRTPVGIDIGAKTAEEIALSILAELVRAVRQDDIRPKLSRSRTKPDSALDPVCGMEVVIGPDTPHLIVDGADHWFCNPGCRTSYAEELGLSL